MSKYFISSKIELKFAANASDTGQFEGYGSVFGVKDWHRDTIVAGAFATSIIGHKAAGTRPLMHLNHGLPQMGGVRGIGVWEDFTEDSKGLHMKGKLSGINTDTGRMRMEQMRDGAFDGMSIGYAVLPGGAEVKGSGDTRERTLTKLGLEEVSIVDDPSNSQARITAVKLALGEDADSTTAAASIANAMRLLDKNMSGSSYDYSSSFAKDKALLMNHLRDAHFSITGERAPADLIDWKSAVILPGALEILLATELKISPAEAKAKVAAWFAAPSETKSTDDPTQRLAAAIAKLAAN